MQDKLNYLLSWYSEHAEHARLHESQRERMVAIVLAVGAAPTAFSAQLKLSIYTIPIGVFMLTIGFYGGKFSLKHYERFKFHARVLERIRQELDEVCGVNTFTLREEAETSHGEKFHTHLKWLKSDDKKKQLAKQLIDISLARYWAILPFLVSVIGIIIIILSVASMAIPYFSVKGTEP